MDMYGSQQRSSTLTYCHSMMMINSMAFHRIFDRLPDFLPLDLLCPKLLSFPLWVMLQRTLLAFSVLFRLHLARQQVVTCISHNTHTKYGKTLFVVVFVQPAPVIKRPNYCLYSKVTETNFHSNTQHFLGNFGKSNPVATEKRFQLRFQLESHLVLCCYYVVVVAIVVILWDKWKQESVYDDVVCRCFCCFLFCVRFFW